MQYFDDCNSRAATRPGPVVTFIVNVPTLRNLSQTVSGILHFSRFVLTRGGPNARDHAFIRMATFSTSCLESQFGVKRGNNAVTPRAYAAHNSALQHTKSRRNGLANNKMYSSADDICAQAQLDDPTAFQDIPPERIAQLTQARDVILAEWMKNLARFQGLYLSTRKSPDLSTAESPKTASQPKRGEFLQRAYPEFLHKNSSKTMVMLLLDGEKFQQVLILLTASHLKGWMDLLTGSGDYVEGFDAVLMGMMRKCFELMDKWSVQRGGKKKRVSVSNLLDDWVDGPGIMTLFADHLPTKLE
ncbi:hypothetical protein HDU98_005870, partial [Podochytrium sp. JEL0797]